MAIHSRCPEEPVVLLQASTAGSSSSSLSISSLRANEFKRKSLMDFPSNTATRKFPAKLSEAKTNRCYVNNYIVQCLRAGELKWAVSEGLVPIQWGWVQ